MAEILLHDSVLGRAAGETVTVTAKEADYLTTTGKASIPGSTVDRTNVVGPSSVANDLLLASNREGVDAEHPTTDDPTLVPRDDLGQTQDREVSEGAVEAFHPAKHTVAEVNEYLEANPKDAERVLTLERDNAARVGVLNKS